MKLSYSPLPKNEGSVLVVTLITALVCGITLMAYMVMISSNQKATVRSEAWNRALPFGEAGIEEALAHLNRNFPNQLMTAGWALIGTNLCNRRELADGFYDVRITADTNPVIYSTGGAAMLVDQIHLQRTIRVQTVRTSIVQNAIATREGIKLNGNNFTSDSYDSLNPDYSAPGGLYDPDKARDNGDIATNLGIDGALDLGNAKVKGKIHTGPNGTITPGPNTSVGSDAWVSSTNGIQPGYSFDDMNAPFPEVQVPFATGMNATGGRVDGTNYNYLLGDGDYVISDFRGKVRVTGNAVILVTDRCQFAGQDFIQILPGASLTMYVACKDASLGGLGVINEAAGLTSSFTYMGLPSNTSLSVAGNGRMSGFIYAPDADVALTGGGEVFGALMGKSLSVTGMFNFHFDEALSRTVNIGYFAITSWDEI